MSHQPTTFPIRDQPPAPLRALVAAILVAYGHSCFRQMMLVAIIPLVQEPLTASIWRVVLFLLMLILAAALAFSLRSWQFSRRIWLAGATIYLSTALSIMLLAIAYTPQSRFGQAWTYTTNTTSSETGPLGQVTYRINRHGFRGPDWPLAKPPGTVRIVLVGDSFVFGAQLPEEETLAVQLEQQLTSMVPSQRWEVISLGIQGNNFEGHTVVATEAFRQLDPDLLFIGLTLPNDFVAYDRQDELRDRAQLSAYRLLNWLLSTEARNYLFTWWQWLGIPDPQDVRPVRQFLQDITTTDELTRGNVWVYTYQPHFLNRAMDDDLVRGYHIVPEIPFTDTSFLRAHGHPSPEGNALVADNLAAIILEQHPPSVTPPPSAPGENQ